jgi:large subunit ribosomal protein L37e
MTKGTPSMGKHNRASTHGICRRCGRHSYFRRKHFCASCGYGKTTTMRKYGWQTKLRAVNGQKPRNRRTQMAIHNHQKH